MRTEEVSSPANLFGTHSPKRPGFHTTQVKISTSPTTMEIHCLCLKINVAMLPKLPFGKHNIVFGWTWQVLNPFIHTNTAQNIAISFAVSVF